MVAIHCQCLLAHAAIATAFLRGESRMLGWMTSLLFGAPNICLVLWSQAKTVKAIRSLDLEVSRSDVRARAFGSNAPYPSRIYVC